MTYLDTIIINALNLHKKVELFLCRDEEGGFGIKIDGKRIIRNLGWEVFEYEMEELKNGNK